MKILNIYVEEFGCLEDRHFELSEGFNLVMGDNESGKSTLIAFIKFMLYGMPRKTQENTAERERSISAKSGRASGSLRLMLENGEVYTVERRGILRVGEKRESYSEDCKIIDERNGIQVHKGAVPGELFLGVPVGVFESTCFVRQMKTTEINTDEVGDSLSNMLLSADESIDLQRSLDRLDALRKSLLHKNGKGGSLFQLTEQMNDLEARLDRAKAQRIRILSCTENADRLKKLALSRRHELDRLDDTFTAYNNISILKRFDSLHACEGRLTSLKTDMDGFKKANTVGGKLPSRELSTKATETASRYRSSLEASRLAEQRLAETERARREYTPVCPDFTAKEIRQSGGVEGICSSLDSLASRKRSKKRLALTLTVMALISVLLGAAAAVWLSAVIAVSISLCAGALILLALGLATFSSSKKLAEKLTGEFDRLRVSEIDGTEAVRAYLSGAFEDELRYGELEHAVSLASSANEMRRADLDIALAEADSVLSEWRVSEGTDRLASLEHQAERARAYCAELDSRERAIREEEGRFSTLSDELKGYSETDIRARIPAELVSECTDEAMEELQRRRRFCSSTLKSITEKQIDAERELIRLESECEDPIRISALLEEVGNEYDAEKLRYDACVAAAEALSAAGANIRDSVTPVIRRQSGDYLSTFTFGRYTSLGIENGCVAVSAEGEGRGMKLDTLSAGTRDAAYLSLRLSLLDILYRSEMPPIALDEALSQLDDTRAAGVLSILTELCDGKCQCLLFTCHSRERQMTAHLPNVKILSL